MKTLQANYALKGFLLGVMPILVAKAQINECLLIDIVIKGASDARSFEVDPDGCQGKCTERRGNGQHCSYWSFQYETTRNYNCRLFGISYTSAKHNENYISGEVDCERVPCTSGDCLAGAITLAQEASSIMSPTFLLATLTFLLITPSTSQSVTDDAELEEELLDFVANIPNVTSECQCQGMFKCPETRPIITHLLNKAGNRTQTWVTLKKVISKRFGTCKKKYFVRCCSKETLRNSTRQKTCDDTDMNASCWKPRSPEVVNGEADPQCGVRLDTDEIVCPAGKNCDAKPAQYPYMALMGYELNGQTIYACGGSLINKYWVLTAAHCHTAKNPILNVLVGEYDTRLASDPKDYNDLSKGFWPRAQKMYVNKVIRHPFVNGNAFSLGYDIALVKLDQPVITYFDDISYPVLPVCIPWNPNDFGRNLTIQGPSIITGWGHTSNSYRNQSRQRKFCQAGSCKLQELTGVPILEYDKCQEEFTKIFSGGGAPTLIDKQICGAPPSDGGDSCGGDSGGPLVVTQQGSEAQFQIGIVSFGTAICDIGVPSVYSKVSKYLGWMNEVISSS